jgi:hypothetical protein
MRKAILALAFFLVLAGTSRTQQHAPTADVCRADANLWDNPDDFAAYRAERIGFLAGKPATSPVGILPAKEVEGRMREMADCYSADSPHATYLITYQFYTGVAYDRGVDFIARHGMVEKFYQEDAAGKR